MTPIPALHVRLEGLTASFRHPLVISGIQLSTPVPAYSNILGMVSACAGRRVGPRETRVGFEFHCQSDSVEVQRTDRLMMDQKGRLKPHPKGQGVSRRQVYWRPTLDLFVTNLELRNAFVRPAATPCFGRSQDIAWITAVRRIWLDPVAKGALGPTLLPALEPASLGLVVRLPDWMENTRMGFARQPGPFGLFVAMISTTQLRFEVERENLYHPSDAEAENDVIYLHNWMEE